MTANVLVAMTLALSITGNIFICGAWYAAEQQRQVWQHLAINEDTMLLLQEQIIKGNQDSMDKCFEIGTRITP